MKRKLFPSLLLALLTSGAAHANLVTNPSFESGLAGWDSQIMGYFGGFSHSGTISAGSSCVGHGCVDTPGIGAFVGQTLTTVPGQSYDLSFWVGEIGGPTSELSVFWNGSLIADILNPANNSFPNMINYSFSNLLATASSTSFEVHGRQDPRAIFFDDFSVTASVPEPTTLALMGLGLAGMGFRRKLAA